MEVGAQDVQGLPPLEKLGPRHGLPAMNQWNHGPVKLIYQWKNERGGASWGKCTIQRLNEASGCKGVLSTWN